MRATHRDVALQPQRVQVLVNHAFGTGVGRRGGDMLGFQPGREVGGAPAAPHRRVVVRHHTHHLVAKQAAHVQVVWRRGPVTNHDVNLALSQLGAVVGHG